MNEAAVKKELISLTRTISTLPTSSKKKNAIKGIYLSDPADSKATVESTLESLGLQVRYLVFDLEATRRENRYLRQMLEARPPRDRGRGKEDEGPASF